MATALARKETPRTHRRPSAAQLLLVANANASGLAGRRDVLDGAAHELRRRGAQVETRVTATLEELAAVVENEERRLVLLGGDGSVHAVANLPGPKPEVALLPAGRANNVAHSLHIPLELDAAAKVAAEATPRPLDLIAASTAERKMLAVEGISVGYHALARAGYHGTNSADLAAGAAAAAKALARFEPITIAIESDGALEVATVSQLFVVNFPLFAFGLHVQPDADPGDGLLDLVAVKTSGRASLVAMLARLRRGTHLGRRGVRAWRASRIRIATGGRSPIIADTTNLGTGPVELTVEPAALEVVTPAG